MSSAIEIRELTRTHKSTTALDRVTVSFEAGVIHGLLGRNGAGKTSLMSIVSGQDWPDSGEVTAFGEAPQENERVLSRICFVREDQKYIEDSLARHAFAAASTAFPNWDHDLADRLARDFQIPRRTRIKKMSRGQRSAVAVIIGIASRADVTFFDEPYMGLDAVARQLFYDRLLEDYAEHPRTIVLSSHLIDEIAHLIENVVLLDRGRVMLDEPVEDLRDRAVTLIGAADVVRQLTDFRQVLHTESLGRMAKSTVLGALEDHELRRARTSGVEVVPVSLQQLIVHLTSGTGSDDPLPDAASAVQLTGSNSEVAS